MNTEAKVETIERFRAIISGALSVALRTDGVMEVTTRDETGGRVMHEYDCSALFNAVTSDTIVRGDAYADE